MSIEAIQEDVRNWRGPDARQVEATLEVAKQLKRIADVLEASCASFNTAVAVLEKFTTPATSVEGPRTAEAECSRCHYRMSYYPEDADLPYGYVRTNGGQLLCELCYVKVRNGNG